MAKIWHMGLAVDDLERSMAEVGAAFEVTWRPVHHIVSHHTDEAGVEHTVESDFTFSAGTPFVLEMWRAVPGTPLARTGDTIVHHVGYWVSSLEEEDARHEGLGLPCFSRGVSASSGRAIRLRRGPGGLLLEPCDLRPDRAGLRDLYPTDSPHPGPPVHD